MGITDSIIFMSFIRFESGLISAFVFINTFTWISNILIENNKKEMLPLLYSSVGLGIFLVSIVSGIADNFTSWQSGWILLGIMSIPFFLISLKTKPFVHLNIGSIKPAKNIYEALPRKTLLLILLTLIFYAAEGFSNSISATFILYNLKTLDFISNEVWKAWAWVGMAAFLSPFAIREIIKYFDYPFTLLLLQILLATGIIMPVLENNFFIYTGSLLFGFSFLSIPPITLGFVSTLVDSGKEKIISDFTIIFSSALFISPVIGGILMDITGNYKNSVFLAFGMSLIGIVSCLFINVIYKKNSFSNIQEVSNGHS